MGDHGRHSQFGRTFGFGGLGTGPQLSAPRLHRDVSHDKRRPKRRSHFGYGFGGSYTGHGIISQPSLDLDFGRHSKYDYYVDDEPHAPQLSKRDSKVDQGYLDEADYGDDDLHADDSCAHGQCSLKQESCAYGQCDVKDSCAHGQCGVKDSCAHGQCGVKEDLDHDGIVHGGDRRIRGSYGYGSYGRRSYGGYAY